MISFKQMKSISHMSINLWLMQIKPNLLESSVDNINNEIDVGARPKIVINQTNKTQRKVL